MGDFHNTFVNFLLFSKKIQLGFTIFIYIWENILQILFSFWPFSSYLRGFSAIFIMFEKVLCNFHMIPDIPVQFTYLSAGVNYLFVPFIIIQWVLCHFPLLWANFVHFSWYLKGFSPFSSDSRWFCTISFHFDRGLWSFHHY